jgi:methionyl-tRNA formyltransferase
MRILFMGTPFIASQVLEHILTKTDHEIIGVVCQPDNIINKKKIVLPPVKEVALKYNLPIYQKEKIKLDFQFIYDLAPDLILVLAYGQIVPQAILDIPKYGCLNLHGSLLPKYRGGAPIQRAIINGDEYTGMTLMQMVLKMDAGPYYASESVKILESDTYDSLVDKLVIASNTLIDTKLPLYFANQLTPIIQDESFVSIARNINKEEELIDFKKNYKDVKNLIHGLSTNPGAYFNYNNTLVKVYFCTCQKNNNEKEPGYILNVDKNGLVIQCLDGYVSIQSLQLPGKRILKISEFVNGNKLFIKGQNIYNNIL